MKNYIPDTDYWMVRMDPQDKEILDELKYKCHCSSYREVIIHAVKNLKPDAAIRLKPLGEINNELGGIIPIIILMYHMKKELSERGFIEFMNDVKWHVTAQYNEVIGHGSQKVRTEEEEGEDGITE